MDAARRLLSEIRDAVYLLDGEGRVVLHNGRLPPGLEPSDAVSFNDRVPESLRVELPLPVRESRTERVRYRDALHHAHVVRRRLVPLDGQWACIVMAEGPGGEESTRQELLGRLVLHVAHDLNNMLTAVAGHADLLAESIARDEPEREWIANLRLAARQAERFAHRLLAFGHGGPPRPRMVELNEHVADVARMLRRLLPIEMRFDFRPAVGEVIVRVDPYHLDQAILALAAGLQDVLEPGGRVTLEVDPAPAVVLAASGLRAPEPSFDALEFARERLAVERPEPERFVIGFGQAAAGTLDV